MSNEKENIFGAFLLGFLTGITFFHFLDKRKERQEVRFKQIKNNLDKGFEIDRENFSTDWQHIYYDFDKSFKKLKQDTYEAA